MSGWDSTVFKTYTLLRHTGHENDAFAFFPHSEFLVQARAGSSCYPDSPEATPGSSGFLPRD